MKTRAFNTISLDSDEGYIVKSSTDVAKIRDEINYYINLPSELLHLFPRLLSYDDNRASYALEYVPFKDLSYLLINNEISETEGKLIINKLLTVLDKMHAIKGNSEIEVDSLINFYIQKTTERIKSLKSNVGLKNMMSGSDLVVNGKTYKTFLEIESGLVEAFQKFRIGKKYLTVIHGDFCFSNILYSLMTKSIRLVDPRGDFIEQGIYGDPLYDYAKLLHCLHGKYDFIVNNRYVLKEIGTNMFDFRIYPCLSLNAILEEYKIKLIERGINLELLYLIESSLFLSMVPLHYEDPERQKALFLTGLMILNNVVEKTNENLH